MEQNKQPVKKKKNQKKTGSIITCLFCLIVLIGMMYFSGDLTNDKKDDEKQNLRYSDYYYYESENQMRYKEFKLNNPIIRNADVVWMVNMNLDYENYENADVIEDPSDMLVLVNKHNMMPISYEPEELKDIGQGQKMIPEAADALGSMLEDAESAGMDIIPQSGYRSYKLQSTIYEENKSNDPDEVNT